jgi:hypothetical protein
MPVKNTVPSPQPSPVVKKCKTDRTLHFLSKIAEKVFTDKFDNMFEKIFNRS